MKKVILLFMMLLCYTSVWGETDIDISLSKSCYVKGDDLRFYATYRGNIDGDVDIYVGFLIGENIYFWTGGLNFSLEPTPVINSWAPVSFENIPFFNYQLSGEEMPGTYKIMVGFMRKDKFASADLLAFGEKTFILNRSFLSISPAQMAEIDSIHPQISLELCGEVEPDLFFEHVKVKVESLTSGKWVEVYPDGDKFTVHVYFPEENGGVTEVWQSYSLEELKSLDFLQWWVEGNKFLIKVLEYDSDLGHFSLHRGGKYSIDITLLNGLRDISGRELPPDRINTSFAISP